MFGPLAPGTIVAGEYRVVRRLSSGGMGSVYVAEQISTGAERALKLMHSILADDPDLRRRFEIEAKVGAKIESEHVAKVIGAGVDQASGTPWLAMELLKGEDLHAYSKRRGPIEPREVVAIFEQLCHALGAAHQAKIVHRDLKPDNVFLAEVKKVGLPFEVKILDFGIAKVAAEAFSGNTAAMGSPSWMSPEQTQLGEEITPATDVWALGLIAFRLLTGKYFWRSSNVARASSDTLLREVVMEPIPPASMRAAEYGASVPTSFDAWFARCVDREPKARFQDAREAWHALAAALPFGSSPNVAQEALTSAGGRAPASRPVSVPPSPPPSIPAPAVRRDPTRRRPPLIAIILATLALASVLVVVALATGIIKRRGGDSIATATPLPPATLSIVSAAPAASPAAPAKDLKDDVEMVRIHGGKLSMGSTDGEDDERPVHPVVVQPFFLDKTEVSVAAYKRCVDAQRCVAPLLTEGCNYGTQGRDLHPVNCVDYEQANAYCRVHGKRLPTEEEWEYAVRAEQGKKYPWGNAAPSTQPCWNGEGNSAGKGKRESTCEVGTSPGDKTPSGLLDMAGNVSEWTATVYCQYPIANCTSPVRVTRGGSWTDFGAVTLRATYRGRQNPADRSGGLGFRCARTP